MVSFDRVAKLAMDRISIFFDLEDEKRYSKRFKKFIFFVGYKFVPFVLMVASSIIMFMIAFRIYNSSGYEKTVVILLVILILSVRSIKPKEDN